MSYNKVGFCVALSFILASLSLYKVHGNYSEESEDGKYFVYLNRKGCVAVKGQSPCPTIQLSPFDAKMYDINVRQMKRLVDNVKYFNKNDKECITSFESSYCSVIAPKCSEDDIKDYGDGNAACWKANKTCEYTPILDYDDFCRAIPKGKQPLAKCVLPAGHDGYCPQPEYKMPADLLVHYERVSKSYKSYGGFRKIENLRYPNSTKNSSLNGTLAFSKHCVSILKEVVCIPMYCSADEERLLIKFNWETCRSALSGCFDKVLNNLPDDFKQVIEKEKTDYMNWCDYLTNSTQTEFLSGTASCISNPWFHKYLFVFIAIAVILTRMSNEI